MEALGGDANGSGGPGGGGRITLITSGTFVEGNHSVSAGSNPDLTTQLQGEDGIFAKIITPSIPSIAEHNFTFEANLSPVELGLSSGLEYQISGLPQGIYLTEDLKLSGIAQKAGSFSVLLEASNRFGETNDTFTINVASGTPSVYTLPSTLIGSTSALLHADVNSTGGEDANLTFAYGTDISALDQETIPSIVSAEGKSSVLLTGLESNQTYYFQARIENSIATFNANETLTFTTQLSEVAPVVTVGPITDTTENGATLHYELVSYDTEAPLITLFWGPVDQGELSGLWESSFDLGTKDQIGTGKHSITGRSPGETFYFRVRAKTSNKINWSESAGIGRTTGFPIIETLPPLDQTIQSATVRGRVISDGGESKVISLDQPEISDGLYAHWRFDEGEGSETIESQGVAPTGRIKGGVTWAPSKSEDLGSALSLWGESQSFVELGSFKLGGAPLSLTGWFNLRSYDTNFRALEFGNDIYGSNSVIFSNLGNESTANWTVVTGMETQLGWYTSTLSGDEDSNISSEHLYTCAINLHGTNITVNGVPFEGTTASSGNGWALTAGFGASVGASSSTVSGNIGAILDQGFKYAGDPQKILITGLDDGQTYRFSMYSQSWGGNRICELSCSDLPGSITVNQDINNGQTPDGLLVECTYIAEGTEAEFTIDPASSATWHLYAFSNRKVLSDHNETAILLDSFWKINQWQHLAISIESDGTTSFYENGNFLGSQAGAVPADLNRSFHIIGGNRLGMDEFNPIDLDGIKLWLDARYGHTVFTDANASSLAEADGDQIAIWQDLSGNGHDAISTEGTPNWKPSGFNGLPTLHFNNNTMTITNSSNEFDGWSKLSAYVVLEEISINVWSMWFGKSDRVNTSSNGSWYFMSRRPDLNPPWYRFRINGTTGHDVPEINHSYSLLVHEPMLLVLTYDGDAGIRKAYLNGNVVINQSNDKGSIHSTSHPMTIGGEADHGGNIQTNYSEFILLENVLTYSEHLELEGHIAHKWDLQNKLPDDHEYKSSPPVGEPKDFAFFNGLIDDLRIYDRTLSNEEVLSISRGDLTTTEHSGGQSPLVYLYWGDEDGGLNPETNSSSFTSWDHKVDLGIVDRGTFSYPLQNLELGKVYYYRFLAENDAGSHWSPSPGILTSGTFSFAADSWIDVDLSLWLDGSDINADGNYQNEPFGGIVDEWRDKSRVIVTLQMGMDQSYYSPN